MSLPSAPARLIDGRGRPCVGVFAEPIADLNARDFIRPGSSRPVRPSRLKSWEYIGVAGPEVIVGGAAVMLGPISNVFFYVFDRKDKRLVERSIILPLGRGLRMASNGIAGEIGFEKGGSRLLLRNDRNVGRHVLEVDLPGASVRAELADHKEPLSCVTRTGFHGFNYTLKLAGMPAAGEVVVGGRKIGLAEHFGVIDFTVGCLARQTFWNWASGGGRDGDGNIVGINLVQGVNETGFTENAFWLGDHLVKVDTVDFAYDDRDILRPWKIRSYDGRVDLSFTPEGERSEDVNALIMASRFHQPFGQFHGTLTDDQGVRHEVEMSGYTEEHYAKW